jgi:hypothetical protein
MNIKRAFALPKEQHKRKTQIKRKRNRKKTKRQVTIAVP